MPDLFKVINSVLIYSDTINTSSSGTNINLVSKVWATVGKSYGETSWKEDGRRARKFFPTSQPSEEAGKAAENSAARRMLYAEKFSLKLPKV